jgi:dTDP-4-amino-4,6-dideoxygalactose transaminase
VIPLFKVHMAPEAAAAAARVLSSGYIGQGPEVDGFERDLAPWIGGHLLSVNSGTSALHLALHLAGVGPGSEVVSTPMTCFATNAPILACKARIVWADINPSTGNLDPDDVKRRITSRTRAVVCVDWGGTPCDLDALRSICQEEDIPLIEDAAHAFGAIYRGSPLGSIADFTAFSFQAIKHLTTVDGGVLACLRPSDWKRGKLLRWYGIDREGSRKDMRCEEDILEAGYKFHMNDVAAAIGRAQLPHLARILATHRENAAFYRETLASLKRVRLLRVPSYVVSSFWLFTLLVEDRPSFQAFMESKGIMVSQVHVRNDHHTATQDFRTELPGVDEFAAHQVSIPVGWWVTPEDRETIARTVREWSQR